jgi:hypothetical protein
MNEIREKQKWLRVLFIVGIIALLAGTLDPLEGSVVILAGSIMIAASTFLTKDRQWKIFMISALLILIGVTFLFYVSSLGGIGGNSGRSWWFGILLLPYPIGWLTIVIALIIRFFRKRTQNNRHIDI